jgi:hypothetical protein
MRIDQGSSMPELMVIFSLAATGSLVRLSTDFALQFVVRKIAAESTASGPGHAPETQLQADPLVAVGLALSCYAAIALGLILALPGDLPIQRTWLAFALLSVGGLVGEICRTRSAAPVADPEAEDDESCDGIPASVGLSMSLMLALNLAMALLLSGQGLVAIVPAAHSVSEAQAVELEPIVVVAGRGSDPLASSSSFL